MYFLFYFFQHYLFPLYPLPPHPPYIPTVVPEFSYFFSFLLKLFTPTPKPRPPHQQCKPAVYLCVYLYFVWQFSLLINFTYEYLSQTGLLHLACFPASALLFRQHFLPFNSWNILNKWHSILLKVADFLISINGFPFLLVIEFLSFPWALLFPCFVYPINR